MVFSVRVFCIVYASSSIVASAGTGPELPSSFIKTSRGFAPSPGPMTPRSSRRSRRRAARA